MTLCCSRPVPDALARTALDLTPREIVDYPTTHRGLTPLHHAVTRNHRDLVRAPKAVACASGTVGVAVR